MDRCPRARDCVNPAVVESAMISYAHEEWLTDVECLEYSDYWNRESEEEQKPFWILDGDFEKMERYLDETGLVRQMGAAIDAARSQFGWKLQGVGCDLAAGALWAEPHLLRLGSVDKIYCVEYSRHRLLRIGPKVLAHYAVPADKIVLVLGDINRLRFKDATLDFVFMSAAFHHSDYPDRLLREIGRVLKQDGLVILIGEHRADVRLRHYLIQPLKFVISTCLPNAWQRHFLNRTVSTTRFLPSHEELFVTDHELGDHFYSLEQYRAMFSQAGFSSLRIGDRDLRQQSFILVRER
jgi:ubiquinone/menaquinone biosynthesis C-methylase UbiE